MKTKESTHMRRIALLGLILSSPLVLSGCGVVGSPFDGFGGFIADTHTPIRAPNRPAGDSQNIHRVEGESVMPEPLLSATGNVWPDLMASKATK
jgi:hypothetical protein